MELEVLRKDMVAAMKAKDKVTKEAVSSLISAVKKVAIDEGCRDEIKSDLVDRVILKELKTVKEQLDTFPSAFPFISAITAFMICPLFFVAITSANFSSRYVFTSAASICFGAYLAITSYLA